MAAFDCTLYTTQQRNALLSDVGLFGCRPSLVILDVDIRCELGAIFMTLEEILSVIIMTVFDWLLISFIIVLTMGLCDTEYI